MIENIKDNDKEFNQIDFADSPCSSGGPSNDDGTLFFDTQNNTLTITGNPNGSTVPLNSPAPISYNKVLLPMLRRVVPSLVASQIVGVQPMSFQQITCEFCGSSTCSILDEILYVHTSTYYKEIWEAPRKDYYLNIFMKQELVKAYYKDILIAEYHFGIPHRKDFFECVWENMIDTQIEMDPEEYRKKLLQLIDARNLENGEYLKDHGIYLMDET